MLPAQDTESSMAVEELKIEVKALKMRCDVLERVIESFESRFDSQENCIESYRKEVAGLHNVRGTLNTSYQGENYDIMQ
jgi:DNA repair ATPase RecN